MNTTFKSLLRKKGCVQGLTNTKIECSVFLIFQIGKVLFLMGKWNAYRCLYVQDG